MTPEWKACQSRSLACQIARMLELMGASPDHVAATMRRAEIRGLRDSTSFMNPIVRYLNQNMDIGARLEVGADGTMLWMQYQGQIQAIRLPGPVKDFLERFHGGSY